MQAYRATLLDCIANPAVAGEEHSCRTVADGIITVEGGIITGRGTAEEMLPKIKDIPVRHFPGSIIVPGFVDTHVHYPQTEMIASYGEQLLQWLERYTFPAEQDFSTPSHARRVASLFLSQLVRNGTTTALVFATVHPESVEALFEQALEMNLQILSGKVLMDRNAPEPLLDTPEQSYLQSKQLIERWHGKGRLRYAVTPRFAATSSPEQLAVAGKLLQEHQGLYLHTHLAENIDEVQWIADLFPESDNYLDVYHRHKLTGPRSVFAHAIHLCTEEYHTLAHTGSAIAFCPSSNLFLGSGLFPLHNAYRHGIRTGLGSDVGAGTSFSHLRTLGDAYKVQQLQRQKLSPAQSLFLATLGGAEALYLQDSIGSLEPGKYADFTVLDSGGSALIQHRWQRAHTTLERFFVLATVGDDRNVAATYAAGNNVYLRG